MREVAPCFNTQPPEGGCRLWPAPGLLAAGFNTQPPEGGCLALRSLAGMAVVSTHSRPKAAAKPTPPERRGHMFQHTAARRRLLGQAGSLSKIRTFQHTAARRRLRGLGRKERAMKLVSTHSRPKAAAPPSLPPCSNRGGFNTQPPEGGCPRAAPRRHVLPEFQHTAARRRLLRLGRPICRPRLFQHTAARRRLRTLYQLFEAIAVVSTHSRPKAAAPILRPTVRNDQFQHTAARRRLLAPFRLRLEPSPVSTHSRPKAAAIAKRRCNPQAAVSTHSRPKAAAPSKARRARRCRCFNTQPPEGGCPGCCSFLCSS